MPQGGLTDTPSVSSPRTLLARLGGSLLVLSLGVILTAALLLLLTLRPIRAAGIVTSCNEAGLDAALAGGGLVTFSCGPNPVTITATSQKTLAQDTTLDGGNLVAISGGGITRTFYVMAGVTLTLINLTLSDGNAGADSGGAVYNNGTLVITNTTLYCNCHMIEGTGH